jgi:hypothetical protein
VGFEIAKTLALRFDVYVVRKLGVPSHEELAMGAIASGGVRVLNSKGRDTSSTRAEIYSKPPPKRLRLLREILAHNTDCMQVSAFELTQMKGHRMGPGGGGKMIRCLSDKDTTRLRPRISPRRLKQTALASVFLSSPLLSPAVIR